MIKNIYIYIYIHTYIYIYIQYIYIYIHTFFNKTFFGSHDPSRQTRSCLESLMICNQSPSRLCSGYMSMHDPWFRVGATLV